MDDVTSDLQLPTAHQRCKHRWSCPMRSCASLHTNPSNRWSCRSMSGGRCSRCRSKRRQCCSSCRRCGSTPPWCSSTSNHRPCSPFQWSSATWRRCCWSSSLEVSRKWGWGGKVQVSLCVCVYEPQSMFGSYPGEGCGSTSTR